MWEDKSGLGQHVTQGTVNRQPLYRSNVSNFNSQPAIDFDGGDWMSCNLFSNWSGDYTLFIALQSDVPNPVKFESFFSNAAGPGTAGAFQIHYMDTSNQFTWLTGNGASLSSHVFADFQSNDLKLFSVKHDATADSIFLFSDGQEVAAGAESADAIFSQYRININRQGNKNHDSKIAEVIIYSRILTDCELETVNQYLAAKYGRDFIDIGSGYNLGAPHDNDINGLGTDASACAANSVINEAVCDIATINNPHCPTIILWYTHEYSWRITILTRSLDNLRGPLYQMKYQTPPHHPHPYTTTQ